MTTRIHSELRKLALAYYRGWLTRAEYLSIRREYLQSITDGKSPAAIDPKKIAPPKKPSRSKAVPKKSSGINKPLVTLAVAVVVILVSAGIYLGQNETSLSHPASGDSSATTRPAAPTDEQRFNAYLADKFSGTGPWEQSSMNKLRIKWLGLSQEQQKMVRTGSAFANFQGALVERIMDERKLNSVVPSDLELSLMTLAKNVGLIQAIPKQ